MKKYRIVVNGSAYEVEVEELGTSAAPAPRVAAPAPTPAAAPAAPRQAGPVPQGAESVTAPMPGKVISFKVREGQSVKEGDLLLILEAMKMENEIFAGKAGVVKEIRASEGSSVNAGDVIMVIA